MSDQNFVPCPVYKLFDHIFQCLHVMFAPLRRNRATGRIMIFCLRAGNTQNHRHEFTVFQPPVRQPGIRPRGIVFPEEDRRIRTESGLFEGKHLLFQVVQGVRIATVDEFRIPEQRPVNQIHRPLQQVERLRPDPVGNLQGARHQQGHRKRKRVTEQTPDAEPPEIQSRPGVVIDETGIGKCFRTLRKQIFQVFEDFQRETVQQVIRQLLRLETGKRSGAELFQFEIPASGNGALSTLSPAPRRFRARRMPLREPDRLR